MGNFTLVVQVTHKSYCSHKKWAQKSTDLHGLNASTTQRRQNQSTCFFFDSKAVHFFFKTMFFLCRILCRRLTFQQIREASPNLFNDRCRSKSEKGHTPVNATVNQHQFSDQITFHWLSWQILAWLYETVGRLQPYQSMTFGSHAIVDRFASDSCMTMHHDQKKPQLLICGNKFGSASVSRREADLDWPTKISWSQWYISQQ